MTTLHVHLKTDVNGPFAQTLRDALMHQATGFWRIGDENLAELDTICLWADADGVDLNAPATFTAPITDWSDVAWICGRSRIIHFSRRKGVFNANPGERPQFNRMGWAIAER